mmetsp:Transcript_168656/g.324210  ORF Transcript_168656/g.324210 Transcript_168656/m.324210 type:complete len:91 (+) Transcript_168656:524-796(+)
MCRSNAINFCRTSAMYHACHGKRTASLHQITLGIPQPEGWQFHQPVCALNVNIVLKTLAASGTVLQSEDFTDLKARRACKVLPLITTCSK